MKRFNYLFYILAVPAVILGGLSCKKFLNTTPSGFLAPAAYYSTEPEMVSALAGVYDILGYNRSQLYADEMFDQLGSCTDEGFYARSAELTGVQVYNFDYTNADINGFWSALYMGIERANNLVANINLPSMDSTERQAILGEALFLRGFYYYLLVVNFGDVPLRLLPTVQTGVTTPDVPRTPTAQVYAQILTDMEAAEGKCYPATFFGNSSRVSQTTVEGVLARVCLSMAGYPLQDKTKYADALAWATKVQASGIHSLNPSYQQIFINEAQDIFDIREAMWEACHYGNGTQIFEEEGRLGNTNGIAYSATFNDSSVGYSYGFVDATAKLYYLYGAGDLRRDWNIATFSYTGSGSAVVKTPRGTLLYDRNCGKWRREDETLYPKNKNETPENFPILRYADVLLMLAEAEDEVNGPDATAYNAINMVRRRGYGLPVNTPSTVSDLVPGLSQAQFLDSLQNERARELCYETLRKPDLVRWGIYTQTMAALGQEMQTDLGSNATWRYASLGATNAGSSTRYVLFPIPSGEISVNKAATQNPGY